MPVTKRIVCLANSRKLSGRCVAGKEISGREVSSWIRPVSARPNEEVSEHERQYKDGSDPRVLDIIDIPLLEARPRGYQSENWLIDSDQYWEKCGQLKFDDIDKFIDSDAPLWDNRSSTYHGKRDRVSVDNVKSVTSSLRLISVDKLTLSVFAPGRDFGNPKRRVQARFRYCSFEYRLRVTDPVYERRYLAMSDQEHQLGKCFLTISIGEPWEGYCYKLVAAIMEGEPRTATA